jgi:predicted nucleic acid-binding protein
MQLVVDASVAIAASHSPIGFARFKTHDLVAPQLLLVEASSVLHEMAWRKEITPTRARTMLDRVLGAPISIRSPAKLLKAAWDLADEMGWAKTYDAQYVALARLLDCKLVTLDERLIRGIERLDIAVRPRDL